MIPSPRGPFFLFLLIPLILFIGGFILPILIKAAILVNILLFILGGLDVFLSSRIKIDVSAEERKLFSIGKINKIPLTLINRSRWSVPLEVKLSVPEFFEDISEEVHLKMKALSENTVTFRLRPTRRGSYQITNAYYRIRTGFGWFHLSGSKEIAMTVEVFPDIEQLNHYLKLTRKNRTYALGIHKAKWQGLGTEIESLRDYQKDDDSRHIDWKASTRLNRPVTKVFQMETNNYITIAIDCGRLMTAEQDGLNTLDHAVNSLLILSHIAFKMGDTLSIVAYSDHILGELYDIKGRTSLRKITRFITRLEPEYVESNYNHVFNYLQKKVKKRSLVIFLTDMIDDINYLNFKNGISRLSRKHLVLFILLRDVLLSQQADQVIHSMDEMYSAAAAKEMFLRRDQAITKLRHHRVNVLDVLPRQLTGQLIDKYLELKARNRI